MKYFNSCIVDNYKNAFEYVVLYINEAHPSNGWYIGDSLCKIQNHTSIKDRQMATRFLDDDLHHDVHVLLDNINNQGQKFFGTKYERLYVLYHGVIIYKGKNGPFGYNIQELDDFLNNLVLSI